MFGNEKEMALGLASSGSGSGYKDNDGNIYKCVDNVDTVLGSSPFRVYRNGEWEEINSFWSRFAQLKKVPISPDLPGDTKVLVREFEIHKWVERHFMKWDDNGNMICFTNGHTSHTGTGGNGTSWKFWKIAEGKYEGTCNNKENSNE